ncbi:MAG: AMP-binding protein, partial [Pseudomonadota bacterium]
MTGGDHGLGGPVLDLQAGSYDAVRAQFRWPLPDRFNIAEACCLRHARGPRRDAPALIFTDGGAEPETVSFAALAREASRFANVLRGHDIGPGSVVALHLPQRREAVVAHVGIQMVGAIALPLFGLFGPDAVRFRLADSAARMLVSTQAGLARIAEALDGHACLKTIVAVDAPAAGGPGGAVSFAALMDRASEREACLATSRDAPAFLMYTSGTTGDPKGVLHGQRVLLGHLPGIVLPHEGFPSPGDRFWTPADWAWAGGLFDALLPSLFYGVPVVGSARRFDPAWARELVAAQNVRNAFIPPTALRLMRGEGVYPERGALRTIGTGGEALGEEMIAWGQDALG